MSRKNLNWEIISTKKVKNVKSIIDILLENRGIKTERQKKEFFNPASPDKIPVKSLSLRQGEIDKAIKRLKKALKNKEKVIVYGDYDADGICGTAVLWESLYSLGLDTLPYIPERFSEGYGLNAESVQNLKLKNENLKLIITVDNGIVANEAVDKANELGIDVIITDHHQPGKKLPKAFSIVHTDKISGSAVAWILAREVLRNFKSKLSITHYPSPIKSLDLVAIGTIADQIPLSGPNRLFVKHGLEALNETKRPGLLALFEQASIESGNVGTYTIGFMIAPRLNAMGRLEHAMESLRLLCVKSPERARLLARQLDKTNLERQKIVEEVVLHAKGMTKKGKFDGVIVLAHETYHEGVIGLAASRLVEEYYRPAIVISKKGEIAKASARSIPGFNIIETIRKVEGFLLEGGGHPMAAGFSIKASRIEEFTQKLTEVANPLLTEELLSKKLKIDLEVGFNQLNWKLVETIKTFEPTGLGNPAPVFTTKEVVVKSAKLVGSDSRHLKMRLMKDKIEYDAIAFGLGELYSQITPGEKLNIAYNLEENIWNGEKNLQLKIKDIIIDK